MIVFAKGGFDFHQTLARLMGIMGGAAAPPHQSWDFSRTIGRQTTHEDSSGDGLLALYKSCQSRG
jgi:hypothetical protein